MRREKRANVKEEPGVGLAAAPINKRNRQFRPILLMKLNLARLRKEKRQAFLLA